MHTYNDDANKRNLRGSTCSYTFQCAYIIARKYQTQEIKQQLKMKWAELGSSGCKQHPNDKQQPGVCSSCLRDKLSKLYLDSGDKRSASPSSSPRPLFSATSSSYVSPAYRRRHHRNTSDVLDSVSSILSFNYGLKKSRSIALASRSRLRGHRDVTGINWGRTKDGFWSKLLKFTKFMHSDTTREANS